MKVLKLKLQNFRGIENLEVEFTRRTTAFVGVNGVGKSSVLDALAIALSQLTWRVNDNAQKARPIALDDISHGADFARIEVEIELLGKSVSWSTVTNRKRGGKSGRRELSELDGLNAAVQELDDDWAHHEDVLGKSYNLPLAVYYDVNRAVLDVPMRVREKLTHGPGEIYQDALDHGGADFKRFFIWFRNFEDAENEERLDRPRFRDRGLQAARDAISEFTGFSGLRVRRKPQMRMVVSKNDHEFNVLQLSDGERNMLAMVGDLARRLTVLNPDLGNPNEGSGIVLIDELDLHLHPGWQRQVVEKLERTFPNCQFVVSTHSPQIVGELQPESVMLMKGGHLLGHAERSFGLTSGDVLEELMEGRARNEEVASRIMNVRKSLDADKIAKAKNVLDALRDFAGEIPEVVELESAIQSLAWIEDDKT